MAMFYSTFTGTQIDQAIAAANTVKRIDVRLAANAEYTFTELIDFLFVSWNIGAGKSAYAVGGTIGEITLPIPRLGAAEFSFAADGRHLKLKNTYEGTVTFYVYAMIRS